MEPYTLLYLFYSAKLGCQASIYFIWLGHSASGAIAFIAAVVAIFSIVPFFHFIVHLFSAKPLSNPAFIAYLCFSFLLVTFSYKSTQDGEQRVLPFAVVTAVDLFSLLIFLLQRQIGRWHDILTLDIEQGHVGVEEDEQRDFGARPQAGRHTSLIAEDQTGVGVHIADYQDNIGWPAMMVREEGRMNQQPDQPEEENTFIHAPRGPRAGGGVPPTARSPATVTDNDRHPALRLDNNLSGPMPPGASHLETSRPEQNQF